MGICYDDGPVSKPEHVRTVLLLAPGFTFSTNFEHRATLDQMIPYFDPKLLLVRSLLPRLDIMMAIVKTSTRRGATSVIKLEG